MNIEEMKDCLDEMWDILFQDMRKSTFERLKEENKLDSFRQTHEAVMRSLETWPETDMQSMPSNYIVVGGKKYTAENPTIKTIHGKTGEVVIGGFKEVTED